MNRHQTTVDRRLQLAQYFTAPTIARFMASLFTTQDTSNCRLLDAGAGRGALTAAFLDRWISGNLDFESVQVDAYEIDEMLCSALAQTLASYDVRPGFSATLQCTDFVHAAADRIGQPLFLESPQYTHAILNPPYKKIGGDSEYRAVLRRIGIDVVNLYAAFVALSLSLLADKGQLVAIIPRSFCNGAYYRPFREYILQRASLRHIHLFESRTKAFKKDDVLQENVIILLERNSKQGAVTVSTSTDDSFSDWAVSQYVFNQIVLPDDSEQFIHIPLSPQQSAIELGSSVRCTLSELGIDVSTGPVVDFRVRDHLCDLPEPYTAPLLYPHHFSRHTTVWPIQHPKKPNAIFCNANTKKWLYPSGYYCVVRRLSSKEEKRRIVASVVDPSVFPDAQMLGFENHLNVFHNQKRGLPELVARGLVVFLNSSAVDDYFRRFNGHTQVNATDLRMLKYPTRALLTELGQWAKEQTELTFRSIDEIYGATLL
jgi:tRNA1(Val) A37 N6-methylase TrmN6